MPSCAPKTPQLLICCETLIYFWCNSCYVSVCSDAVARQNVLVTLNEMAYQVNTVRYKIPHFPQSIEPDLGQPALTASQCAINLLLITPCGAGCRMRGYVASAWIRVRESQGKEEGLWSRGTEGKPVQRTPPAAAAPYFWKETPTVGHEWVQKARKVGEKWESTEQWFVDQKQRWKIKQEGKD